MPTYNSGSSNYPSDYDLLPTTGTATISYLLDQIRDPITGAITQSGDTITALNVNSAYTILQRIEDTLGLNIQDSGAGFSTVADRLNYLAYSGVLAFVPLSGGSMFGDLTMSGSTINVDTIASTGLIWTMLGTSVLNSSGNLGINSSGNMALNANSYAINLTANTLNTNFATSNLSANGINQISGNTVVIKSTSGTSFDNSILASASGIDIGSTGVYFNTIYVSNIVSTGLTDAYVSITGDTVLGDIYLNSGISIYPVESGNGLLGSSDYPFSGIYSKTLYGSFVSGLSPVTFLSDVVFSGTGIGFAGSGTTSIGTMDNPIGMIYADNATISGLTINGFVTSSGDTMLGDLTFSSGTNVVLQSGSVYPETSGVGSIGLTGNRFDDVYTNKVNGRTVGNYIFNEILSGTGVDWYFSNAPLNNYAMIFVSGLLLRPTDDYTITGTGLTTITYSGATSPVAGFYIY